MRIAICDSSGIERKKYQNIFEEIAKQNNIETEFMSFSTCEELLFCFEGKSFMDVLFIDVNMPGRSGIETSAKLRELGYTGEIVFLTDSDDKQHLLSGYDVGALHYIIKDQTSKEKIEEIVLRIEEVANKSGEKYVLFTAANEWVNIPIKSIRYFEIYKKIITVYYGNDKFEFHAQSFANIREQMDGFDFITTHRSYIVALKEIKSLTFRTLTTRDGKTLPVGRTFYPTVKEALVEYKHVHSIV